MILISKRLRKQTADNGHRNKVKFFKEKNAQFEETKNHYKNFLSLQLRQKQQILLSFGIYALKHDFLLIQKLN